MTYRGKLTLGMRRGPGDAWTIGLHPFDDPVNVFQLADCPITVQRPFTIPNAIQAGISYATVRPKAICGL